MKTVIVVVIMTCIACQSSDCLQRDLNDDCTACQDGYFLDENKECVKCALNCNKCENGDSCSVCDSFHFVDESQKCSSCDVKWENCLKCSEDECLECGSKYFLDEQKCYPCYSKWEDCDECTKDECTQCPNIKCESFCNDKQTFHQGNCRDCDTLIENCDTCRSATNCETCTPDSFENESGECVKCSAQINFCETCSSKNKCDRCIEGYEPSGSGCSSNFFETEYYDDYVQQQMPCYTKFSQCRTCNYSKCIECEAGFTLVDKECVPLDSSIKQSFEQNGENIKCSSKFSGCNRCTADGCKQCFYSNLVDLSGNCVEDCPVEFCYSCARGKCLSCLDYERFLINNSCQKCEDNILGCKSCRKDTCNECKEDYDLIGSFCQRRESESDNTLIFIVAGSSIVFLLAVVVFGIVIACKRFPKNEAEKKPSSTENNNREWNYAATSTNPQQNNQFNAVNLPQPEREPTNQFNQGEAPAPM